MGQKHQNLPKIAPKLPNIVPPKAVKLPQIASKLTKTPFSALKGQKGPINSIKSLLRRAGDGRAVAGKA